MSRSSLTLHIGDDIIDDEATVAPTNTNLNTTAADEQHQSIDHEPILCSRCRKQATFMCSSCGLNGPRYCSVECQKVDWKESHYKVCEATIAARRSRRATTLTESEQRSSRLGAALAVNSRHNTGCQERNDNDNNTDIPMIDLNESSGANDVQQRNNNDNDERDDEEFADELKFYMQQIYFIIKPVVACIILSIFWVKVAYSGSSDYSPTRSYVVFPTNDSGSTATGGSSDGGESDDGGGSGITQSLTNALIIIGQIIVVTVVIVFFFRKGWIKVLIGFFMIVVLMLLGFMTYLLLLNLIQVFSIPLDYITMIFALWNFAVAGLVSIFWKGPLCLQQAYLTVMSSLMAFSLTGLEEWTTWILLGLLAVWDLIAVLCPFGPLRLLIESSRKQQREVPALLYSVNAVWFMLAASDHLRLSKNITLSSSSLSSNKRSSSIEEKPLDVAGQQQGPSNNGRKRTVTLTSITDTIHSLTSSTSGYEASTSSTAPLQQNAITPGVHHNSRYSQPSSSTLASSTEGAMGIAPTSGGVVAGGKVSRSVTESESHQQEQEQSNKGFTRLRTDSVSSTTVAAQSNTENVITDSRIDNDSSNISSQRRRRSNDTQRNNDTQSSEEERDEDDVERSGLKLGLGDFVFYSVLIARAALYDWITTVCCTIAVLTGLTTTIFLLAIYKKALPALPISIAFGILFYFVSKTVLVPYIGAVCVFGMVGL